MSHWIHRGLEIKMDGYSAQELKSGPNSDHISYHVNVFPNVPSHEKKYLLAFWPEQPKIINMSLLGPVRKVAR